MQRKAVSRDRLPDARRSSATALPSADGIDTAAIVRALPDDVSGADLREVVRRTVLSAGPDCGTADFVAAVASGRWRAAPVIGSYL
ncbi:hypothetical protein [Flexivirga alba]|uniref:Uncharacterized protein n=1 Tax=Flexivirga alba TaxID=702742 RepID=A0ABW2AAP9_9MICO